MKHTNGGDILVYRISATILELLRHSEMGGEKVELILCTTRTLIIQKYGR